MDRDQRVTVRVHAGADVRRAPFVVQPGAAGPQPCGQLDQLRFQVPIDPLPLPQLGSIGMAWAQDSPEALQ